MPSPTPPRFSATSSLDVDVVLLSVEGEVDLDTAAEFEAALNGSRQNRLPVVVDLLACTFMDSTGLQRLLRHREESATAGLRTAVVYAPDGVIARLVDLVAPGLFESAGSVAEARAALTAPGAGDAEAV